MKKCPFRLPVTVESSPLFETQVVSAPISRTSIVRDIIYQGRKEDCEWMAELINSTAPDEPELTTDVPQTDKEIKDMAADPNETVAYLANRNWIDQRTAFEFTRSGDLKRDYQNKLKTMCLVALNMARAYETLHQSTR